MISRYLLILFFILIPLPSFAEFTALQIAQKTFDRYVGDDMQLRGTMELINAKGKIRSRSFITLRKDQGSDRKALIRFTSPADIAGTSFLTLENDNAETEQHLYLPALKRTRRIVSSQKGRSFVNSDFSYEDMQRHRVEDWNYELKESTSILDKDCIQLVSYPKPQTDSQYSKVSSCIDIEHFVPLATTFWDKKGKQIKTYQVKAFEIVDGIFTETDILMTDLKSGHKTRLTTQQISYNSGLKDSLFTKRALEK